MLSESQIISLLMKNHTYFDSDEYCSFTFDLVDLCGFDFLWLCFSLGGNRSRYGDIVAGDLQRFEATAGATMTTGMHPRFRQGGRNTLCQDSVRQPE